jgi:hypothetical protein
VSASSTSGTVRRRGGAGTLPGTAAGDDIEKRAARDDAAAARHLAAARDRDIADLGVKVDDGFRRIDEEFRKVDDGFIEMRGKFDATAAGLDRIVTLLEERGDRR